MLDEPTSGLDPIVRREFIQTVIGAYQDGEPGRRTVFVSTHLISEFEGLIDEFTIIEQGSAVLTLDADAARERYQKIYARFAVGAGRRSDLAGARVLRRSPRDIEVARQRQRRRRARSTEGAIARDADGRVADARGDLRRDAPAAGRGRMIVARVLPWPVAKEVRALLPVWLGSIAAIYLFAAVGGATSRDLGMLAYGAACAALGALSIGHEYSYRTLPMLLSHPASRARILLVKLAVLAVMLIALSSVAWRTGVIPTRAAAPIVGLSVLCALSVAPWLTMLSRNPLAGAVLTMPVPGWVWVIASLFAGQSLKLAAFEWGMVGVCVIAAVLGWRLFMRLEAIEGRSHAVWLPTARADAAAGRLTHPMWLLAKKELALQLPSIAVAAIYVLGWLAVWVWGRAASTPDLQRALESVLGALTLLYSGLLAIVIGSLASAEERQLGTLESQVLLPMASWRQWAVKVATALGLTMLLTVGVPALSVLLSGGHVQIDRFYAAATLLLMSVSLYVSSLSANGLRAFLVSLPATLVILVAVLASVSSQPSFHLTLLPMSLFALLLLVILYFALLNHRSAERGLVRVSQQAFCIGGVVLVSAEILSLVRG